MKYTTESIWEMFCCKLKSFILKKINNDSVADDIQQEVFIKIHENIDKLRDETKIKSWVYQITRNTITDYYRANNKTYLDIDSIQTPIKMSQDKYPEIIERDIEDEITSGLKDLVVSLPEKYAQAILLTEYNGLTQVELAKKLKISSSGAKSRVQRARQMIKDTLMNCCHYEFDKYGKVIGVHPNTCCCCNPR